MRHGRHRSPPSAFFLETTVHAMATNSKTKAKERVPELRIGTSGWHYGGWWGPFYPADVPKKQALSYYSTRFDAAELNAPFYRTPTLKAIDNWRESTPDGFRFSWKASKFLTHWRRLIVDEHSLDLLEERAGRLGEKLGPILFQLPPKMKCDRERLAGFLKALNRKRRYSFEFRHPGWYEPGIFDLLRDHDISLCLSDHADAPAPREVTAGWVYVRNHGPSGRYHGSYSDAALKDWARSMRKWLREGHDVWCFFDNDVKSAAPADAERLRAMVSAKEKAGGD
jgi:uncharacterized protein YecE (DUF72 family)